jgi:membrane protein YqaA with SNARE-associated domain
LILTIFSPGLIGLFFASFLAATILPFSSEAILAATIYFGASPTYAIIIASTGNWLGGITSYYLGYLAKWEWLEKYFKVKQESVLKWQKNIEKFGPIIAFLTWLPFIGDVLAIGLGYFRVNFISSISFMLLGKTIRYIVWYFLIFQIM